MANKDPNMTREHHMAKKDHLMYLARHIEEEVKTVDTEEHIEVALGEEVKIEQIDLPHLDLFAITVKSEVT
jgi:hypothetical protein